VLRVQKARVAGQPAHRVSIQFAVGHRTLLVPPARLVAPQPQARRQSGWLADLGRDTLDDRLRALPQQVTEVLGTPSERLAALIPLYETHDDSASLLRWARAQTGVADPLSLWSRDELQAAFDDFCTERDALLRNLAARLRQSQGPGAVPQALASVPEKLRPVVRAALQRLC
jgi:hypothetical protein